VQSWVVVAVAGVVLTLLLIAALAIDW